VHLLEVDPAPEVPQLIVELASGLFDRRGPDLRSYEHPLPGLADSRAEMLFGGAIHRRRIEELDAGIDGRADHVLRHPVAVRSIEHRPRS
jgi:hypothetical protein